MQKSLQRACQLYQNGNLNRVHCLQTLSIPTRWHTACNRSAYLTGWRSKTALLVNQAEQGHATLLARQCTRLVRDVRAQ
jgi:hypothetical protein